MSDELRALIAAIEAVCAQHQRKNAGFRDAEQVSQPLIADIRKEIAKAQEDKRP
jgi:hypothetical protein